MSTNHFATPLLALCLSAVLSPVFAADAPPSTSMVIANGKAQLRWTPYPGADIYTVLSTEDLNSPFAEDTSGSITGLTFTASSPATSAKFFSLVTTPISSNNLLAGIALNRLAYGQTPDDLEMLLDRHPVTGLDNSANQLRWTNLAGQEFVGAAAYVAQQLEPWRITETVTNTHASIATIGNKFTPRGTCPLFVITNGTNTFYSRSTNAQLAELRSWFILHALGAKRQLLEVLLQFLDNHFTTQYNKSYDYSGLFGNNIDGSIRTGWCTTWEFWEIDGWRQALLNPTCTFYDLLKIHIESPAEIVYLDTVGSRGDGSNVPNENYARELMELFTMGVDNGYEQTDIVELSKVWTGWTVGLLHPTNAYNPFATTTTNRIAGARNGSSTNLFATWTFRYNSSVHRTGNKLLWTNFTSDATGPAGTTKKVPARFGTNWASESFKAGYDYSLALTGSVTSGTNSIQEGYLVAQRLNDIPFTAEYLSVKLCRLLVSEKFPNPTTRSSLPEYAFYDYTNPDRSAEAELVRQCMLAWESTTPKGQIWKVLAVIVNSDLFRSQAVASQKIKTPLEFTMSAIRALRSSTNGTGNAGTFSASTDGTSSPSVLVRMGGMDLFNRDFPDGYSEFGSLWVSASTLAERTRWAQSLCLNVGQNGKTDSGNSVTDVRGLLYTKLPPAFRNNAALVADYLVNTIYPTEGRANMDEYKKLLVNFLNDGSADVNPLDRPKKFSELTADTVANSSYDGRVRSAAALLLSMPRFQEQ